MPAPVRYPNGVTNVDVSDPLHDFIASDPTRLITYFNDFHTYTAGEWTVTETDAASTQAVSTGASGGVLLLTHDTTTATAILQLQNPNETFRLSTNKRFWMKARFSATAATMANYGVLVGLSILDTSAVAGVTDGFYFRKQTGASVFEFVQEKDSAESTVTLAAAPGLTTATMVEVAAYYDGKGTTEAYLNGVKIGSITSTTNLCNDEDLTITLAAVNATAGAANVLSVDYIFAALER
jgi:hypothetical protein